MSKIKKTTKRTKTAKKQEPLGKVTFTPCGQLASDLLAILFPYGNPTIGGSACGSTDRPLVVHSLAGTKVSFLNAVLTKMPEIYLSPVKTAFGYVKKYLEERGIKPELRAECSADLAVNASIPERYIRSAEQRMDIYRRIALIRTEEEADDLTDELIDRFGDPPPSVNALIHVALMRGEAGRAGITDITQKAGLLRFTLAEFDMEKVSALYAQEEFKGRNCHQLTPANHDNIVEQLKRSAKYRMEQIKRGVIENDRFQSI